MFLISVEQMTSNKSQQLWKSPFAVIMAMLRVYYDLRVKDPAQRKSISQVNVFSISVGEKAYLVFRLSR